MIYRNNASIIKRELMAKVADLAFSGELARRVDKIPYEMIPKRQDPIRCCVHKDRAVLKYRLTAILGFPITPRMDESLPLSHYARLAEKRERNAITQSLTVIDEACDSCHKSRYTVTNLCRGCVARPCLMNCPFKAISMENGKAVIDPEKCRNCGICEKACPYHAINFIPVPCENACPVGAIEKDENGVERIDEEKCIHCGKCMSQCPFAAVMEVSQLTDVIFRLNRDDVKVTALIAPAVAGQYNTKPGPVKSALKRLGFDGVMEVAEGAVITAKKEKEEWEERVLRGEGGFMTTSCCPAYVELVEKHVPDMKSYVSETISPMKETASIREKGKNEIFVFIGPCVAKRNEAMKDDKVDYVLTFEELGSMFIAKGIDVNALKDESPSRGGDVRGHYFPRSGGVTRALQASADDLKDELKPLLMDGVNKKNINQLKVFAKGKCPHNFIEVMVCEGGCIAGPGVISAPKLSGKWLDKTIAEIDGAS